jgi:PST family polysaccharide transporter
VRDLVFGALTRQPILNSGTRMAAEASSYRQILKASALMGGASLVNVGAGIVRTKVMAVLLGPAGFGLMGAYVAIVELAKTISQLGFAPSGVRQIASSSAIGEMQQAAVTSAVLRRLAWLCGLLGAAALWAAAPTVARVTFGSEEHAGDVALLGIAVLLGVVSGGQTTVIQGLRRITVLSRMSVVGSLLSVPATIVLVTWLGRDGVVWSLIAAAVVAVGVGAVYYKRAGPPPLRPTLAQLAMETRSLLHLGLAFLIGSLLTLGTMYAVRTLVLRHAGLEAAGLYQAAWTLGGLYVGFILQALGTDFYPRLVGEIVDRDAGCRLVNEQTRVGLLLAGPGLVGTLALAPVVMEWFYSREFADAVDPLRWFCVGIALRVMSWPMGFMLLAANRRTTAVATDTAWSAVMLGAAWVLVPSWGAAGAGAAFCLSYVFHVLMIATVVRRYFGFRWSPENMKLCGAYVTLMGITMVLPLVMRPAWVIAIGALLAGATGLHSIRALSRLASLDVVPAKVRRLLELSALRSVLRLSPKATSGGQ